jgi:hypothetical protein
MAYTPLIRPNINKMAGATQHKIPAIAALMEYFKLHLIKFGFFSCVMMFYLRLLKVTKYVFYNTCKSPLQKLPTIFLGISSKSDIASSKLLFFHTIGQR